MGTVSNPGEFIGFSQITEPGTWKPSLLPSLSDVGRLLLASQLFIPLNDVYSLIQKIHNEVVARQCARHYDMVMEKMKNKEDSGLSMWNLYSEQT